MGTQAAQEMYRRLKWTSRLRPMIVGAFVADLLAPERRTIIETETGLQFFADPLSNFGGELIKFSRYEEDTEKIIRNHLFSGDCFLDIGANEGYFTVVAASIVGHTGRVVAVEPQSRLCDIIKVNLALNDVKVLGATIFHGALGGEMGQQCELHLYPSLNTGAASIVRKPKLYRHVEKAVFVDPMELLGDRDFFKLAKVDVEGYEGHVIQSLLPLLKAGKIHTLLIDYHAPILAANGTDPSTIEATIFGAGMRLEGKPSRFEGYRLYRSNF